MTRPNFHFENLAGKVAFHTPFIIHDSKNSSLESTLQSIDVSYIIDTVNLWLHVLFTTVVSTVIYSVVRFMIVANIMLWLYHGYTCTYCC
jgi:hypothetical protein